MTSLAAAPPLPFYLPAAHGARLCIYHAPAPGQRCLGGLVYVAPFAEEMNRSRRMAALQAQALAQAGVGVLLIDLYGCGDSAGELAEASWAMWRDDVSLAIDWLRQRTGAPVGLWGLRLGALLALEVARRRATELALLLLWNPVVDAQAYMTQFLRLQLAAGLGNAGPQAASSVAALRAQLQQGQLLEVGGYELNGALVASIDDLRADAPPPPELPLHWLELVRDPALPLPPGCARLAQAWSVRPETVAGPAFWSTPEVTTCAALIEASCTRVRAALEHAHAHRL